MDVCWDKIHSLFAQKHEMVVFIAGEVTALLFLCNACNCFFFMNHRKIYWIVKVFTLWNLIILYFISFFSAICCWIHLSSLKFSKYSFLLIRSISRFKLIFFLIYSKTSFFQISYFTKHKQLWKIRDINYISYLKYGKAF